MVLPTPSDSNAVASKCCLSAPGKQVTVNSGQARPGPDLKQTERPACPAPFVTLPLQRDYKGLVRSASLGRDFRGTWLSWLG